MVQFQSVVRDHFNVDQMNIAKGRTYYFNYGYSVMVGQVVGINAKKIVLSVTRKRFPWKKGDLIDVSSDSIIDVVGAESFKPKPSHPCSEEVILNTRRITITSESRLNPGIFRRFLNLFKRKKNET